MNNSGDFHSSEPVSFGKAVFNGVRSQDVIDIAKDTLEAGVDAVLEDSAIALVPGVRILSYLAGLPSNVSNQLFKRSVLAFIVGASDTDHSEWIRLVNELADKDGGLDRAGDVLARYFIAVDDTRKATYLGKLYAAAAKQQISVDDLYRMQMVLNRVHLPDLEYVSANTVWKDDWVPGFSQLVALDVLSRKATTGSPVPPNGGKPLVSASVEYRLSAYGKRMLIAIGLISPS